MSIPRLTQKQHYGYERKGVMSPQFINIRTLLLQISAIEAIDMILSKVLETKNCIELIFKC